MQTKTKIGKENFVKKYIFFVAIVAAGLLAGCQSPAPEQTPSQAPAPRETAIVQPAPQETPAPQPDEVRGTLITADNLAQVTGQTWTLQSMTIGNRETQLTSPLPTLKLETDGAFAGQSFINRYFGSYQVDKQGRLQWPAPIGATRMAGPMDQLMKEIEYLKALPQTDRMTLDDDSRLVLRNETGAVRLVFAQAQ